LEETYTPSVNTVNAVNQCRFPDQRVVLSLPLRVLSLTLSC